MKNLLLAIALILSIKSFSQVGNISLQASGLTCSMCSNAISKALYTIPEITNVEANIKNSTFEISFKPGAKINFDQLKQKVEDAGFHVAKLMAMVNFDNLAVKEDTHVNVDGMVFHFLNVKTERLNGLKQVQILDKGFVPAKEFKKNAALTTMSCYKTGVAGDCCVKNGITAATRIYHVTI